MQIFAIVGDSGTGKTRLIKRLIAEWKRRQRSVSVIKHCGHGFSLDIEGKDTWEFMQSGADGVSMLAADKVAVIQRTAPPADFIGTARKYFPGADVVIVEGGSGTKNIRKIEVMRKGISSGVQSNAEELTAVVSDSRLGLAVPEFRTDQIRELIDFLESRD